MMRRVILLVAVGVTVLALAGCGAMGASEEGTSEQTTSPSTTPLPKVTATPLTRATLGEFKAENDGIQVESGPGSADVALVKVVLEPGGSTGWHHHPGVALVSVGSGSVTEYHEECHPTVYKTGKGFVESQGHVHIVRNEGKVAAELYVTFIVPTETSPDGLLVADPQPKDCNVS